MVPGGMPGTELPGATAAMVCGIVAVALSPIGCCFWYLDIVTVPLGIVAIVLGVRARGRQASMPGATGSGKAMAGIITGAVAVGLAVVSLIVVLLIGFSIASLINAIPTPTPSP